MSDWSKEFQFANPHLLWLLGLLPLLIFLRGRVGRHPAVQFSGFHLLSQMAKPSRGALGAFLTPFILVPMASGIIALARPQFVHTEEKVEDSGIEIMICMDVSLSMAIEDYRIEGRRVNRLTVAKNVIRDFVAGRKSDRIGLVAFAGRPYVASPLTMDQKWFNQSLDRVAFNLVEDGTAIGSALLTGAKRLDKREAKSKILLLLTDGANNSGSIAPVDAARQARTLGIKVYTIAIGTPGKHNIPIANRQGFLPGVRQEFDDETMKKVAEIGEGKFFKGQDTDAVKSIFAEIDQLEKTKLKFRRTTEVKELFPYPVAGSILFLITGLVLTQLFFRRYPS